MIRAGSDKSRDNKHFTASCQQRRDMFVNESDTRAPSLRCSGEIATTSAIFV
jgi:hypothetical protein